MFDESNLKVKYNMFCSSYAMNHEHTCIYTFTTCWYICDCCYSQLNSVQSCSQAPGFLHFQYFNGKPGQGPGNKANVGIHACTFELAKTYSPSELSVYRLNFLQLHHRLKPGEAMTFNNRRFIHSRTAFKLNGGMRHLQVLVALLMCVITLECIVCHM